MKLETPDVTGLDEAVRALREWQHDSSPFQLHPGDVGWFWRFGAEATAAAVRTCPTGALRYQGLGDLADEAATEPVSVEVRPNGPLYVRGRVRVTRPGGEVVTDELRVALCRCGASQNKPFCDNSHRLIGFRG